MNSSNLLIATYILSLLGLAACRETIDPRAAFYISETHEAMERMAYNAALAFTDSANAYDEDIAEVYFLRGRIYTELARFGLADSSYRQALNLDPDIQGAWLNRGNLAIRKGDINRALSMYVREASIHPTSTVYLQMGRAYAELGAADSARIAYEQAIEMDSTRATLYMRLGQLYGEEGDLDRAIEYTRKGLDLEPENTSYYYALGSLLNSAGRSEEAASYLEAFVEENPWHYWAHYNLGQAYQRMGQEKEAERYLAEAETLQGVQTEIDHWQGMAESNPRHLMLWIRFSHALRKAGNSADAERAERIVYSLAPEYMITAFDDEIAARHGEAVVNLISGELEKAIETYRGLLRENQTDPALWLNLGVLYAAHGRIVQARQSWEVAVKYDNDFIRAHRYLQDLAAAFYDQEAPGN